MIEKTYYDTRPDGVELYQRKSTLKVKIRQIETGEAYDDPIDTEPCPYTYQETDIPIDEYPEWKQPTGAQDAYMKGDKCSHNDKHWISDYDNNVWEPGVFGWAEE